MSKKSSTQLAERIAQAIENADSKPDVDDGGRAKIEAKKLLMLNTDGEMLKCKMTLGSRVGAPNPLCVVIHEEKFWIKRGEPVTVPWYVVTQFLNNIERRFYQVTEDGKKVTKWEDTQSEPISYTPIKPLDSNPAWL